MRSHRLTLKDSCTGLHVSHPGISALTTHRVAVSRQHVCQSVHVFEAVFRTELHFPVSEQKSADCADLADQQIHMQPAQPQTSMIV